MFHNPVLVFIACGGLLDKKSKNIEVTTIVLKYTSLVVTCFLYKRKCIRCLLRITKLKTLTTT